MDANENQVLNDSNPTILRIVNALFGKPYIPIRLLVFLALAIITDYAYWLLREPAIYWFDYSQDITNPLVGFRFGPFVAMGICLGYVAVVVAVLRVLNRKVAFILWGGFVFFHLSSFILYPPSCSYEAQQILPIWLCHYDLNLIKFIIGTIVGLALAWGLFEERKLESGVLKPSLISKIGLTKRASVLCALWLLFLGVGIGIASHIPTTGWKPVITKHVPAPRYEAMVAYDTKNSKAILFGGTIESSKGIYAQINDTWEWDGKDWTQLKPAQSPPARYSGTMAYDPKRNITILFGGWDSFKKSLGDTWAWDGKNWEKVGSNETAPYYYPPPRSCQNMYYDTVREEIIMYGGCNENQVFFHDAWGWNGKQWENIDIQESPLASGAPIIYDSKSQSAIGFLAGQPSGTWIWNNNGWSKPILATEPPPRANAKMANDPETGNSLMFGGQNTVNNTISLFNDTWIINGTAWHEIKNGLRPPGRWGHVVFFDAKLKKFMVFGGFSTTTLNDLWEISPAP